jgi:ribonuclease P/MRP protein subunit POP3
MRSPGEGGIDFVLMCSAIVDRLCRPSVRPNVVNSLVARVVDLFDGVAEFTTSRDRSYRKRKRTSDASIHVESEAKRPRLPDSSDPHSSHTDPQPSEPALLPRAWSHLLVGINEVTKRLEWQASTAPKSVTINSSEPASSVHPSNRPVSVIFACIHDVKTPLLLAHLPRLVASCNSRYTALDDGRPTIRLVPCPKGTETILAGALGFRRASVVALEVRRSSQLLLLLIIIVSDRYARFRPPGQDACIDSHPHCSMVDIGGLCDDI